MPSRVPFEVFDDTPLRMLMIDDIAPGEAVFQRVVFDRDMLAAYERFAQDHAPVHHDASFAQAAGFSRPIVQGLALSSRFSRLIGMYLPGARAVLQSVDLKFRRPVYADVEVVYHVSVERVFSPLRVVQLGLSISVDGSTHVSGACQCLIR